MQYKLHSGNEVLKGNLPHWDADEDAICKRIRSQRARIKVVLKTCNEPVLLPVWLEHYLSFLEPHEIIIADNMSTLCDVHQIYARLPAGIVVFQYSSSPAGGFHNVIHDRCAYVQFYEAVSKSCDHVLLVDTDELLIVADESTWCASRNRLHGVLDELGDSAAPTAWFEAAPRSLNRCLIGATRDERLVNYLAWGKPVVPSSFNQPGALIHNGQFPEELFRMPRQALILIHLSNFSPEQRLAANRQKLLARGVIDEAMPYAEIAALDCGASVDPTVHRLVRETAEILHRADGGGSDDDTCESVSFEPAGILGFTGERAAAVYRLLFTEGESLLRDAFSHARDVLTSHSRAVNDTSLDQDRVLNMTALDEADLRSAMQQLPTELDGYGDPTFRKELIRLLLSQARFDEASALVPEPGGPGRPGWHHVLFARAHQRAGRVDEAARAWRAVLDAFPGDAEALAAIKRSDSPASLQQLDGALEPRMSDAERLLFGRTLRNARFLLEFGAGGSTSFAARHGVGRIVSVESDRSWLDCLAERPEIKAVHFTPFHVDVGPTGEWGTPVDPARAKSWPAYYRRVWSHLASDGETPDVILVDGRFRVACVLSALLQVEAGTQLMVHDFWDRPHYHCVLAHLECIGRADTLGVFVPRGDIDWRRVAEELIDHALDVR